MLKTESDFLNGPQLVWIVEPENKRRFRYGTEGGSHGALAGKPGKKTYPTLKLVNYYSRKQVIVRVSLYTEDKKEHVFEFKGKKHESNKCYIEETIQDDNIVVFKNLQIIVKKKDEIEEILMERKLKNLKNDMCPSARARFEKSYSKDVKERARTILNSLRLYFVAYEVGRPDVPICSLFSDVISNQKTADKGDLRICRLSHWSGSCKGGEEVILLCEKVQKESIKVKFYEKDEHGIIIWEEYAHFSPADVHHQVAIPFKTPPYKLNTEKTVSICLERTNGELSEPRDFTYKAEEPSSKKRKIADRKILKQNTPLFETMPSPPSFESSESISSSEPTENVSSEMPSASSTSHSDDSNPFEMGGGVLLNENDIDVYYDVIQDVLDDKDFELPFSSVNLNSDADFDDDFGAIYLSREKQNFNLDSYVFHGQMDEDSKVPVREVCYGQMGETVLPSFKDRIVNQNLDLVDGVIIDEELRNLTLKDKSDNESKSDFKNCHLNKFFEKRDENLKWGDLSLQQKKEVCSKLLQNKNESGNTLLHIAVMANRSIVPILKMCRVAGIHLSNTQNFKKQTPLHFAVDKNRIETVRILLQSGGNPNLKDDNRNNCYHIAAKNNNLCALRRINHFSRFLHKVDEFNDEGLTPIHIAIMQKNSDRLFDLLKIHVTNPNILEKKAGKSLLHYAIDFQPSLISKILKMADIDVNIQDFEGNTPLHIACSKGDINAVKLLLQSGADPSIKNVKQNSNLLDPENSEDETSDGQLPADLTTSIEILKLLRNATETEVEDALNLQNSDNSQESDEIPCHIKEKLCRYLDDKMRWKNLATYFIDENIIDSLNLSSSPTKVLLDYIKKQEPDCYLEKFKNALVIAQLPDALDIIGCNF